MNISTFNNTTICALAADDKYSTWFDVAICTSSDISRYFYTMFAIPRRAHVVITAQIVDASKLMLLSRVVAERCMSRLI